MSTTSTGSEYSVAVSRKEVVRALLPLQEHTLRLSNLDWLLPPVDVGVFFCYRKPDTYSFSFAVAVLKKALAQVLVSYYAFAGELLRKSPGEDDDYNHEEFVLVCNNRGVDFIEAHADVELKDLNLHKPDASVEGKLVPKREDGVLCLQVTELECGGMVVACTFDHRIADAFSANMFLVAWAESAQQRSLTLFPTFERSLLRPRENGHYDASIDDTYISMPLSSPPPSKHNNHTKLHSTVSRIYYITADNINRIQSLANINSNSHEKINTSKTKLVSFTAFLWQSLGRGIMRNNNNNNNNKNNKNNHGQYDIINDTKTCKIGVIVDGRERMAEISNNKVLSYFGNVISIPFGELSVNDLNKATPWSVADAVHEILRQGATKEHFLGLIDWVQVHRPNLTLARIYCSDEEEVAFVVSSGQRFPVRKMDFGWGEPAFGSYHFEWESTAGYVMPMPSPRGDGDWVVYVHCRKEHLEWLEEEVGDVFAPLTKEYLNLAT